MPGSLSEMWSREYYLRANKTRFFIFVYSRMQSVDKLFYHSINLLLLEMRLRSIKFEMKKSLVVIILFLAAHSNGASQVFISKTAYVRFFSKTPLEDIEGITKSGAAALNIKSGKVLFRVTMTSFKFEKALMQEHFNENYMESDKFPTGDFDGQIIDLPDLSKDGEYSVKVKGNFTIHGVKKEREFIVSLKVAGGKILGKTQFKVKCVDHNIEIPKLVVKNIAEDLEVGVEAEFLPKK